MRRFIHQYKSGMVLKRYDRSKFLVAKIPKRSCSHTQPWTANLQVPLELVGPTGREVSELSAKFRYRNYSFGKVCILIREAVHFSDLLSQNEGCTALFQCSNGLFRVYERPILLLFGSGTGTGTG